MARQNNGVLTNRWEMLRERKKERERDTQTDKEKRNRLKEGAGERE